MKLDFIIIGAQKCGTTWMWNMLDQHPGTDLPKEKEIFFFSDIEKYSKGIEWYERKFKHLDSGKIIGEASTDYLYDRVLYKNLNPIKGLPPIPELIISHYPSIKVIVILRDPVRRAISAYLHHLARGRFPLGLSVREVAQKYRYLRILERGDYLKYLKLWYSYISDSRINCVILEEDIIMNPQETVTKIYRFLNISTEFTPMGLTESRNRRWNYSHIVLGNKLGVPYHLTHRIISRSILRRMLELINFMDMPAVSNDDIEYLRNSYLPQKAELSDLLNRSLDCWLYQ